ncbi:predicted protein [Uncinocarpus reesii 1704]|uniref:Uncharacterized protein n=1 Tax=Uncinocarpus reesii (strain UAMH 1704) TaxID=336963 RepID=C4JHN5_UNCRE|nr:uncharacterized protein UREG_02721 [Uncinocarpus reesii 1704]EEP77872.1 predicted protein [Uncinocarpus reesii 1704]
MVCSPCQAPSLASHRQGAPRIVIRQNGTGSEVVTLIKSLWKDVQNLWFPQQLSRAVFWGGTDSISGGGLNGARGVRRDVLTRNKAAVLTMLLAGGVTRKVSRYYASIFDQRSGLDRLG